MSRDQRLKDNWALLYAAEQAAANGAHVAVAFNLVDAFLGAGARQFGFMLRGLKELAPKLEAANIRFHLLQVRVALYTRTSFSHDCCLRSSVGRSALTAT